MKILKNYSFTIILFLSIIIGSICGLILQEEAKVLKPIGDIFLNLLFTIVVPLVFFSISSAIAGMSNTQRLGKILGIMMLVFITTGAISSLLMV
ncbi:sodium:proton antiporter, partial [Achromatium sp. WMS1]